MMKELIELQTLALKARSDADVLIARMDLGIQRMVEHARMLQAICDSVRAMEEKLKQR